MAARLNPAQDERTRSAIKTSQLVNRLQAFVFEEKDATSGKPVEMSKTQVAAAVSLLKKTLPDLQSTQVTGEGGGPINATVQIAFVAGQRAKE